MKKFFAYFILIFGISNLYGGGQEPNDTSGCDYCGGGLWRYSAPARVDLLKQLVRQANPDEPENFARIRILLCSLHDYLNKRLNRSRDAWWHDIKQGDLLWDGDKVLKEAIKNDARDTIKLLYNNWNYRFICTDEKYQKSDNDLKRVATYSPIDLNILAENFDDHEDPVGMLELLMSYRNPEHEYPHEDIPEICRFSCSGVWARISSRKHNQFCKAFGTLYERHNKGILERFAEKLERIGQINKEQSDFGLEKESELK